MQACDVRVQLTGSFVLTGTTAESAMTLFTPEGERRWVPAWDPYYPGDHTDVWVTGETTWVTTQSTPTEATYARLTPGDTAGFVQVKCTQQGDDVEVTVTYDLTAIGWDGEERLPAFEAGYPQMLEEWRALTQPCVS